MSAAQGGKRARATIIAVAALCAAGALYFALPDGHSEEAPPAATPADAAVPASQPDAPATAVVPEATMFPVTRSALAELAASPDLRTTVSSESCATANGRAAAAATLQAAENSAQHVHDLIEQSVAQVRSAADSAPLESVERDGLREDVRNATEHTLMLAGRLQGERLQAISAARRLLDFMEENAGSYEVQDGAVRFSNPSAQVQFSHFQVNTTRVLGQELLVRRETADALAEQEQLLARTPAH